MHEHIARTMYFFSIHLLFASLVGVAAWLLTSIRGASATTKYWIWVVTALNFVVPAGALIDKLWALHLSWAKPLGAIGGPIWDMTEGRSAVVLGVIWMAGALFMLMRLLSRLRREHGLGGTPHPSEPKAGSQGIPAPARLRNHADGGGAISNFVADGVPVSFGEGHPSPAVRGVLHPRILLPMGLDRLLNQREFDAVLIHEVAHARRRDNLIRLLYEVSLCALWFHPLLWLAGARMALYRELSCDESVIRRAHGEALVSALAKLAVPVRAGFLEATASSHLGYRLARLAGPAQKTQRAANIILTSLFAAVIAAGIFQTIAHTACCFVIRH